MSQSPSRTLLSSLVSAPHPDNNYVGVPSGDFVYTENKCGKCGEVLKGKNLFSDGIFYHSHCFHSMQNRETNNNVTFTISQPAEYQIANYNIHPPPTLTASRPVPSSITIRANLMASSQNKILTKGFQIGESRVLKTGQSAMYFTGLKVNKMGPIKSELQLKGSSPIEDMFCIEYEIGDNRIRSKEFRIVSSCSQVPENLREAVRPMVKKSVKPGKRKVHKRNRKEWEVSDEEPDFPLNEDESEDELLYMIEESHEPSSMDKEMTLARQEMEQAIKSGDAPAAGLAAQRLAALYKEKILQDSSFMNLQKAAEESEFQG